MKINNKPMSALPSVADAHVGSTVRRRRPCRRGSFMRLPVRLVYNLAEGSPRRRGRPVSLPPSYHLITGFYHLEPFLRFGKHVRETASFQQKGPPLTEWPSIIVELRGFEPLTLSMPWRCATSCAIAPKSALQTLYNIHRRHKSRKFRRVARTEELA